MQSRSNEASGRLRDSPSPKATDRAPRTAERCWGCPHATNGRAARSTHRDTAALIHKHFQFRPTDVAVYAQRKGRARRSFTGSGLCRELRRFARSASSRSWLPPPRYGSGRGHAGCRNPVTQERATNFCYRRTPGLRCVALRQAWSLGWGSTHATHGRSNAIPTGISSSMYILGSILGGAGAGAGATECAVDDPASLRPRAFWGFCSGGFREDEHRDMTSCGRKPGTTPIWQKL